MGLLFIDTETGGLDPAEYDLVEVAWATLDNPEPQTLVIPHDPNRVGDYAKRVNNYEARDLGNRDNWAKPNELFGFLSDLQGATLVGANAGFDEGFLMKSFMFNDENKPWHYRKLDVESIAYKAFGYPKKVPGMKDIFEVLTAKGFDIPEPDHTAAGDVRALIASFNALRNI